MQYLSFSTIQYAKGSEINGLIDKMGCPEIRKKGKAQKGENL